MGQAAVILPPAWFGAPRPSRPSPDFWHGLAWGVLAVVVAALAVLLGMGVADAAEVLS